jgi:AcrR family transcriptional regulator
MTMTDTEARSRASIGARRSPATEKAVLDAAESLLTEAGYSGLSMDAVARRARASKATVYRWWPTRARLLMAVYDRRKAELVMRQSGPLEADLLRFFEAIFGLWRQKPLGDLFRLLIAEAQFDPDAMAAMTQYAAERRSQTEAIFTAAAARGELAPHVDTGAAAEIVVALAWNHLLTNRIALEDEELRAMVSHLAAGFVHGGKGASS